MSTPSQEVMALANTRTLLDNILANPETPTALRKDAELCSKHYPMRTAVRLRWREELEREAAMMPGPVPDWMAELIGWRE